MPHQTDTACDLSTPRKSLLSKLIPPEPTHSYHLLSSLTVSNFLFHRRRGPSEVANPGILPKIESRLHTARVFKRRNARNEVVAATRHLRQLLRSLSVPLYRQAEPSLAVPSASRPVCAGRRPCGRGPRAASRRDGARGDAFGGVHLALAGRLLVLVRNGVGISASGAGLAACIKPHPQLRISNDLVRGRQPASLFLGIDFLPVNESVKRAWPAQANALGNLQFAFDALFQAHGLRLDVASKETALDFDGHRALWRFRSARERHNRRKRDRLLDWAGIGSIRMGEPPRMAAVVTCASIAAGA